jgi:quercetin dioxygenase-like cupin family protein
MHKRRALRGDRAVMCAKNAFITRPRLDGQRRNDMLANLRRVVTEHRKDGLAAIRSNEVVQTEKVPGFDVAGAVVWTTEKVPADNVEDFEGERREEGLTLKGGSVARVTDMGPGFVSPMHRTHSIDYGVVLSGEIELELDSGEVTRIRAGDIVVQRGTNHIWRNPSATTWTRILFVMIEADPVEINGVVLSKCQL